jgi:hypothetical protein
VTGALKNLVGVNGNKNYLPHHRLGGSGSGGDCYPGFKPFKRAAEAALDHANSRIGRAGYRALSLAAVLLNRIHGGDLEGKWYGNDTAWRMVLDLNRLLVYGRADGTLAEAPQRRVFSITDALICGEGNGPLAPEERHLGAVTFAENSAYADLVHSGLMRFDWHRIPLIREAFSGMDYPLTEGGTEALEIHHRGSRLDLEAVRKLGANFRPPDGWIGHI